MDIFHNLSMGFAVAFTPTNLMYCLFGVTIGTLIGVLPGIGAIAAVSIILPVTFYLEPTAALVLLAGVYYGAEYGGSTASILLNIPGTTSSAVTALDGHPMTKKGRAGVALFMTAIASFFGACVGIILLTLFAPLLARLALAFGPAEYFSVIVLGLLAAATISKGSPMKGVAMVILGLLLGTVGTDLHTGAVRFTFGAFELFDGISVVVLAMGLFGVAEVISASGIGRGSKPARQHVSLSSMIPRKEDVRVSAVPAVRGSIIGSIFGALPGTGQTLASFMSYALEKRLSRSPGKFGQGAVEGIVAPEAANNAAAQSAFIPTLTLGIPGTATMALMLAAMMIHGIAPGPDLMTKHAPVFWGLIASFWIGNFFLLVLNIPLINVWVRILHIPSHFLFPGIICLVCLGVFSINNSPFDVFMVLGIGLFGYAMRLFQYEAAPLLMGFVLGPLLEQNLRRAMLLGRGDPMTFFHSPISAAFLITAFLLLAWAIWATLRRKGAAVDAAV